MNIKDHQNPSRIAVSKELEKIAGKYLILIFVITIAYFIDSLSQSSRSDETQGEETSGNLFNS